MMNIHYKIIFMVVVFLSMLIITTSLHAKENVTWQMPTCYTSSMPSFKVLERMSENLEKMSNGRFKIKVYPGGALIPGKQIYDEVSRGSIQIGCSWPNWWKGKHVAWNLLNDQPFGFRNKEAFLMWYYFGGGMEFPNKLTKKDNILWRPGIFTSTQTGFYCTEPIKNLEQLEGKTVRIGPGLHMDVLEEHNIRTVMTSASEVYTALERGVVDACEWVTPAVDYPLKFHEVAPYILVPGWWQPAGLSDFLINEDAYKSLPEDFQIMLDIALREASVYGAFKLKHLDRVYLDKMKEEGAEINRLPDEDLKALRKTTENVYKKYAKENELFRQILESQRDYRKKYNEFETTFKLGHYNID